MRRRREVRRGDNALNIRLGRVKAAGRGDGGDEVATGHRWWWMGVERWRRSTELHSTPEKNAIRAASVEKGRRGKRRGRLVELIALSSFVHLENIVVTSSHGFRRKCKMNIGRI